MIFISSGLGLASCDHLSSFLAMLQNDPAPKSKSESGWQKQLNQPWMRSQPRGKTRRPYVAKHEINSRLHQRKGRWLLTSSFAMMGKVIPDDKRAKVQARLLLQRYGIVVKEFYRREQGLVPWYNIFKS